VKTPGVISETDAAGNDTRCPYWQLAYNRARDI